MDCRSDSCHEYLRVGIIQRIEYESSKLTIWVRFPVPILYVVGSLMVKPVIVAHET